MDETTRVPPHPGPHRRRAWRWLIGLAVGFGTGMICALVLSWAWQYWRRSDTTFDLSRPTVVRQIQQLARLETVVFGMDRIVAGGQESRYLPAFLSGDRMLLTAYGEVIAGVDLRKVGSADITIQDRQIAMQLPAAEIFSTRIDNARTKVYSRQTGLFTAVDPGLETEIRQEAERQIHQAAIDGGVLTLAATNARTTLETFLRAVGFEQVEFR